MSRSMLGAHPGLKNSELLKVPQENSLNPGSSHHLETVPHTSSSGSVNGERNGG